MRSLPIQRLLLSLAAAIMLVVVLCVVLFPALGTKRENTGAFQLRAPPLEVLKSAGDDAIVGHLLPREIKHIALIAERHSGSTWMTKLLQSYFKGKKELRVRPNLCNWKHWFQDRIHEGIQAGDRLCRESQQCPACMDIEHTLVVAMWRNPYDWISGMQKNPHHAQQAHGGITDLCKFMTKRWMVNPQHEQSRRQEAKEMEKNMEACIDNFLPSEVVPCNSTERSAIYELDADGVAYGNIYELRKAKIKDFNAVETWSPYYERIQYENVLLGDGLKDWLHSLETKYGLAGNWSGIPDAALAESMRAARAGMYYLNSEQCSPLCTFGGMNGVKAVETLHNMWDWDLESSIGYHQVG